MRLRTSDHPLWCSVVACRHGSYRQQGDHVLQGRRDRHSEKCGLLVDGVHGDLGVAARVLVFLATTVLRSTGHLYRLITAKMDGGRDTGHSPGNQKQ